MSNTSSGRLALPKLRTRAAVVSLSVVLASILRRTSRAGVVVLRLAVGATLALPAAAQVPSPADPVVVTATRTPQPLSTVLADVSVLDRADIQRSGAVDAADLLARLPGMAFSRNGGPGGTTGVFVRGSESRHVAVYVDGVRIDSQGTGGALWEQIPLEQIDRIEVLRGPGAAVYGSDAIGGVVQFFTRRGEGALRATASLAAGTRGTVQAQAGARGATAAAGEAGGIDYAVSGSSGRSRGINARSDAGSNPDDDGWRRNAVHARAGWQATREHRIDANVLASKLRAQFDGFGTDDDVAHHTLRTAALGWQGRWTRDATTQAQGSESRSTYESQPSFFRTETTLRNLLLQHEHKLGAHAIHALVERREDQLHNPATAFSSDLAGKRAQTGAALGWRTDRGSHALHAQVRHDRDSEFGGHTNGSLAWGWHFLSGWRATASAATSFRAPTLYQRFSEFGVGSLEPEQGRNVEVGLRWAGAGSELGATAWRNTVTQLIGFGAAGACASTFGCFENVGRARLEGLTFAGRTSFGAVALRGSIDLHDPRNLDTGTLLARRARRMAALGADTTLAGFSIGAEVQAAGARFDDAANTQRMGGYALVNLVAGTTLAPGLALEACVDNAADKRYELARSYNTEGRSARLMLRWSNF